MNNLKNQALQAETDSSLIRAELERLLSDRRFSGARQMSAFLRYIVSETLDGNGNRIKAFTVGVDALGKPDDFDAQSDPSVRVLALRLRKSLEAAYTDETECHAVIVMTVGSYVPEFFKPDFLVPGGDAEKSLQTENAVAVTDSTREMSDDNTGTSLQNDFANGSNSADRHLADPHDAARQPRFASGSHHYEARPDPLGVKVARMAQVSDVMTEMLRKKWLLVMAIILLAAAWQVSMNTVSAATVLADGSAVEASAHVADHQIALVHT